MMLNPVIPNPWLILAVIAAVTATGWQGYRMGSAASEARHAAALSQARDAAFRAAEIASARETARLALQAERDALTRDLEDAAHEDADADRPALTADSVRRLNRR